MTDFVYKEESYKIRGAIFAVHRELGCGFLERVYQDALEYEFQERGIPYEREKEIRIMYKGKNKMIRARLYDNRCKHKLK